MQIANCVDAERAKTLILTASRWIGELNPDNLFLYAQTPMVTRNFRHYSSRLWAA